MWWARWSGSVSRSSPTRHFVQNGWPLGEANVLGVLGAGALFLARLRLQGLGVAAAVPARPAAGHARARGRGRRRDGHRPGAARTRRRGRAHHGRSQVSGKAGRHRLDLPLALPPRPDRQCRPDAARRGRCGHRGADRLGAGRTDRHRRRRRPRRRGRRLPAVARASSAGRAPQVRPLARRPRGGTEGGCAGLGPRRRLVGAARGRRLRPARRALGPHVDPARARLPLRLGGRRRAADRSRGRRRPGRCRRGAPRRGRDPCLRGDRFRRRGAGPDRARRRGRARADDRAAPGACALPRRPRSSRSRP